jgi:hypothetical protein
MAARTCVLSRIPHTSAVRHLPAPSPPAPGPDRLTGGSLLTAVPSALACCALPRHRRRSTSPPNRCQAALKQTAAVGDLSGSGDQAPLGARDIRVGGSERWSRSGFSHGCTVRGRRRPWARQCARSPTAYTPCRAATRPWPAWHQLPRSPVRIRWPGLIACIDDECCLRQPCQGLICAVDDGG